MAIVLRRQPGSGSISQIRIHADPDPNTAQNNMREGRRVKNAKEKSGRGKMRQKTNQR